MSDAPTKEELSEEMRADPEYTIDLDNAPKQNHLWTDRGAKFTCENAGHAWHEYYKRIKPMTRA
jgi:hypothetical protein